MEYIDKEQYAILSSRRQVYDTLMWQTPVLSLTAQAFLFTIALGSGICQIARIISALLAFLAAFASIQLMMKHRYHEFRDSKSLEDYERAQNYVPIHGPSPKCENKNDVVNFLTNCRSYRVWLGTLGLFGIVAIAIMVIAIFAPRVFL
jgi:hypothetical protein